MMIIKIILTDTQYSDDLFVVVVVVVEIKII